MPALLSFYSTGLECCNDGKDYEEKFTVHSTQIKVSRLTNKIMAPSRHASLRVIPVCGAGFYPIDDRRLQY
jgi:hypothetical protein